MQGNFCLLLISISVLALILITIFVANNTNNSYINAGEIRLYKLQKGAYDVSVDHSKTSIVETAYKDGRLLFFVGETNSTGGTMDKEIAKLYAYQQFAEYLNSNINVFKKLVEGSLSKVENSSIQKEKVLNTAENVYKSITTFAAEGKLSGTFEYASWKYKDGGTVKIAVLIVWDPKLSLQKGNINDISNDLTFLENVGIDFSNIFSEALIKQNNIGTFDSTLNSQSDVLIGVGEGRAQTHEEAQQIAQSEALKNLAQQIYVQIDSKFNLKEIYKNSNSVESFESEYEKIIRASSKAELYGVSYTILETKKDQKGFLVRVKAEIRASDAFQNFKANLLESIVRSLRNNKLIFSAKKLLDGENFESYSKNLPAVSRLLSEKGLVEREHRKASELVYLLKGKSIRNLEEAIDIGNIFNELETIALDYPEELIPIKSKVYEYAKNIKPVLKVQNYVWKDEIVYITLSLPKTEPYKSKSIKIIVTSENCKTDSNFIVLKESEGQIAVNVENLNPKVAFYFGGYQIASWTPKVFDTQMNYRKELISSSTIIFLILSQQGDTLTSAEKNEVNKEFYVEIEKLFRQMVNENELKIKMLNESAIEKIFGDLGKFNMNTIIDQLRNYKIARYVFILTPSFNIRNVGNWTSLNLSLKFNIVDLMTYESFYESFSKESLGTDVMSSLKNIISSEDFSNEFKQSVSKYMRF